MWAVGRQACDFDPDHPPPRDSVPFPLPDQDSSVSIATRCGPEVRESNLGGARFSAPVQTGPGAHPASCTMGTESFPGVKRPGRGVDHPPSSSAEVKERIELYLYLLLWAFVACYRVNWTFCTIPSSWQYHVVYETFPNQYTSARCKIRNSVDSRKLRWVCLRVYTVPSPAVATL